MAVIKNNYLKAIINDKGGIELYLDDMKIPGVIDISLDQDIDFHRAGLARATLDILVELKPNK